ncbi:MAG: ACP S-malonyltransferase [Phycisphaerae bacterium]
MKTAFLFPGQGAQAVGMGKDLYETFAAARRIFDTAEAVTGLPIKKLCFEGPEEELSRTDIAQPAIFTVSAALLACMSDFLNPEQEQAIAPLCLAGLSLGEYTALYAAGAMDLETALKLVTRRGAAMQAAATAVPSGMVSIIGLDEAKANELCVAAAGGEVLVCANFNAPGQIVLSGALAACKRADEKAKDFGASGAVPLKVAGAFHSPIMQPAADELGKAIDQAILADPRKDVVSNVDARLYRGAGEIKAKLLGQLVGSVRWQQCMEYLLAQGVERFYEIGPGRVLAGLMRRINRKADVVCVNSKEAIEKLSV